MTRPSIGARLVCTSKIDKKIPTRRVLFFSTSFSSSSTMSVTVPSAAATITFGSAGAARSGSRKNAIVHKQSSTKNQNANAENNPKTIASSARKVRIQRASQRVWRRIKRAYFQSLKGTGQDTKIGTRVSCSLDHNIVGLAAEPYPISSGNKVGKRRDYLLLPSLFQLCSRCGPLGPTFMAQIQ